MPNAVLDALTEIIAERLKTIGPGYKHTTPTGTPVLPYLHGPGGLFGVSGVERDVFSTHIRPMGLLSVLPARGSMTTNPLYPYITGFAASTGSNPNGVCDDGKVAGPIKNCFQTAQFGRYTGMTEELEVDRVGQRIDRGELDDFFMVNPPTLMDSPFAPASGAGPLSLRLQAEMSARMIAVGVEFERELVRQIYDGNPANNSGGGGYKEFPGLSILVGTNKQDALSGAECPSLDSDVKNFGFRNVAAAGSPSIVKTLTEIYRIVGHNAERMSMLPVQWAWTMRPGLFRALSEAWPCDYNTYRCSLTNAQDMRTMEATAMIQMTLGMRQGQYLLIDGVEVPVILDDGIDELSSGDNGNVPIGGFASDIYLVPMTVRGGRIVTYLEYLDYTQGAIAAIQDARLGNFFWSDGGRFLWHAKPPLNWCIQLIAKVEPRIILLTPHLAGRLQNVVYVPLQHERESLPEDPYWRNGGVSTARPAPSMWSDWNLKG